MEFAVKTSLMFDPVGARGVVSSGAGKLQTAGVGLGPMAMMRYVRASVRAALVLDAVDSISGTLRVTDGVTDYASASVSITSGARADVVLPDIDLTNMPGSRKLSLVLDVASGGTATGTLNGVLDVETPVVVA